jgi:hypothetical protein
MVNSCRHEPYGVELLDTVCFNTQILPILQTSCGISGCHGNGSDEGDFEVEDFESIIEIVKPYNASSSKLYQVITDINGENFMPPNRPLPKEMRTQIMVWIEQGAKNTICVIDDGGNGGNGGDPLNYDTICFNQSILPILVSSCGKVGCHDAISHEGDYVLTSYSTLTDRPSSIVPFNLGASKIYKVITESNPEDVMPPPPNDRLSSDQIELFSTWILEGALNSDCPWTACDTLNPISFSEQVWPIIQNNCLGCHSASSPSGGVDLSSYSQVMYYSETLVNGTPILMGSILQLPGFSPMPPSGPLSSCQTRTVELWIEQGLLDN